MTAEKRGVWADLMALAGEAKLRDGTLRFDVGQPMSRDYISSILRIDRETLDACLVVFQNDLNTEDGNPRIKIWEDGTIELTNFARFQTKFERKEKEKSPKSPEQLEAITRRMANQFPESARDGLSYGFQDTILDKDGEILRQKGETKTVGKKAFETSKANPSENQGEASTE